VILAALGACSQPAIARPDVAPIVPGLHDTALPANLRGRVLLGELGCTSCHQAGDTAIERRVGPNLATVGNRVQADYLQTFLLSPHATEPGTVMPDVLRKLDGKELHRTAEALTHYLRSHATDEPIRTAVDSEAAERGRALYESIGCQTCHAESSASQQRQEQKYTVQSLQAFLLAPHEARPAARMPKMALSPAEAFELANHLLQTADTTPTTAAPSDAKKPIDAKKVAAGRGHFATMGCANCHDLPDAQRPASSQAGALKDLDASRGCLSGQVGAWPHYALSNDQLADVRAALSTLPQPLPDEARIQQLLASRNCFACHNRADIDAVANHQEQFTSHDLSLGQDGRLPPTLTGIGAKLQRDWLSNSIAHGQLERPYLKTRMPGFGDAFAEQLTGLLTAVDELPDHRVVPLPEDRKQAEVITKLGQELVGDHGMNCITCHLFAGEKAGAMGSIDLVHSTGQRLRPEWFGAFLRDPYRFKSTTLMPKFFPDGKSTRPEFVAGDPQQQIDAMWHYLAEGRNVRKPRGMHHAAIELEVADVAVMLRRSVQNTGKRGISVGYPGGVNITFDAENLGLNQIWWGRFIDARPVWTGQGSGQAQILGRDRITLPNGPAILSVDPEQPWPTATRRERGDRWLGYDLDAQQRPTFRYTSGDITIEDTPREAIIDGQTLLRRTLTLSGKGDVLNLLVARDKDITRINDHLYRVGKFLHIDTGDELAGLQAAGDEQELRLMTNLEQGASEIHLEYSWHQEGK